MKVAAAGGAQARSGWHTLKFVGGGLVDQVLGQLDEEHLVAHASEVVAVLGKGTRLARAHQGIGEVDGQRNYFLNINRWKGSKRTAPHGVERIADHQRQAQAAIARG